MNPVRRLLAAAVLIVLVAACSGSATANVTPPPEADVSVTASSGSFEDHEVAVPAGRPFEFFRNLDPAPHNVAIYADDTASDPLFVGETITNAAITYEVPALEPGAYFFRCDVHPEMTGTVVATG